jgi:hypothetical protein
MGANMTGEAPLTLSLSPWERERPLDGCDQPPLPWGEGWGEGRFPRSSLHPAQS